MKKKEPEIIKYKFFKEKTGTLTPFYIGRQLLKNFNFKRFFFLYGKKKYLRADHAHKKCSQILIPIFGRVKVTTYFNKKKKIFLLDPKKGTALKIPVYTWLNIKFHKNDDCLLTACNYKYDKKEYISDFKVFLKKYF